MSAPKAPGSQVERARVGFRLDLARCVGCGACVLGCRNENRLPSSVSWRRVLQVNSSRIGGGPTYHLSVACHHCDDPPCVGACPTAALEKRPDGLVLLAGEKCIGCRYCEMACPFGAPSFDSEAGVMTKCHLCHSRLDQGLEPACVEACPTHALTFTREGGAPAPTAEDEARSREDEGSWRVPGFGDPALAGPSFRMAAPGGARRSEWFRELQALMGLPAEESHDPE